MALVTRQVLSSQNDTIGVYLTYDDGTLDLRSIRVRNNSPYPIRFHVWNGSTYDDYDFLANRDVTTNLQRNKYQVSFDSEGSLVLPTYSLIVNPQL